MKNVEEENENDVEEPLLFLRLIFSSLPLPPQNSKAKRTTQNKEQPTNTNTCKHHEGLPLRRWGLLPTSIDMCIPVTVT